MIWLIAVIVIVLVAAVLTKEKRSPVTGPSIPDIKLRADSLPSEQQDAMAEDIRKLASAGYDRVSQAALQSGKTVEFANEAGVLDAVFCILANSDPERQNPAVRRAMQLETIPFNKLDPSLGRKAITEYLVWKFFPAKADFALLRSAMNVFVVAVFDEARGHTDADNHIFQMIYSSKFDWQTLAIDAARDSGEKNA